MQLQALAGVLKSASTLQSSKVRGKWENSLLNTGIFVINCSSRPLERCPAQTCHIHVHVWRFLLGQEFNWFLYNQTKWRAAQTDLPPQHFKQDTVRVRLYMLWRTSKELKSEKAQTQGKALNKACRITSAERLFCYLASTADRGTAFVQLSPRSSFGPASPEALGVILTHSSSRSHFFVVFSERHFQWAQKATTAPAFQSHPSSPRTALVPTPSSASVIASPLHFLFHPCAVITGSTTPRYATSQAHPQFNSSTQATMQALN